MIIPIKQILYMRTSPPKLERAKYVRVSLYKIEAWSSSGLNLLLRCPKRGIIDLYGVLEQSR